MLGILKQVAIEGSMMKLRAGLLLMLCSSACFLLALCFLAVQNPRHFGYQLLENGPLVIIAGIAWRWPFVGGLVGLGLSFPILAMWILRAAYPYDIQLWALYSYLAVLIIYFAGAILTVISARPRGSAPH